MEPIYGVADGVEALTKYLNEQRKLGLLSKKTYDELLKRVNQNSGAVDNNTSQLDKTSSNVKKVTKIAADFAANTVRASESIRKNREDFTSLNPAVKVAGKAAELAGSTAGKLLSTVGDAVNALSIFGGPITKIVGTVAGAGMGMLGDFMEKNSKQVAALGQAFGSFALQELQSVVSSYRTIGSVGATTSRGMTGVYDDAIRAGMGIQEYAQLVSKEGENLAGFAGSTTAGAEALGKVSQANEGYKKEYLALGYTYAEQQEYTAEYLKRNRVTTGTSINDTQRLAEGSREYMDMLDDISRLTGKTRSEAAKSLEKQESNLRFQASLRLATKRTGDEKVANNMRKMAEGIEAFGSEGMAQGFMDMTGGLGTKAARDFNLATNGEGQKIAEMVKNGEIDHAKGLEMVQAAVRRRWKGVGGDDFAMKVAKTGSAMDDALPGMARMVQAQDITAESLEKLKKEQQDAKKAKDQETSNIISAQEAMRQMAIDMDKIVKDKVFPLATTAVDNLTDIFVAFVDKASDTLGLKKVERKKPTEGGTEPTTGGGGGGAAPPPEGAAGKPELTTITTKSGKSAQVNSKAADSFTKIINWLEDSGYKIRSIGGFADRDVRGRPGMKSAHAMGAAIDINPDTNPLGSQLVTDMPSNVGDAAKAFGLGWGGAWNSRKDAMHFSAATREGGNILKFAQGGIASGPKAGYTAMLHGTEAVVPMPDGNQIPMEPTGLSESTENQIKAIRRQNQIISELIAAARNNNDANKRLLSLKAS